MYMYVYTSGYYWPFVSNYVYSAEFWNELIIYLNSLLEIIFTTVKIFFIAKIPFAITIAIYFFMTIFESSFRSQKARIYFYSVINKYTRKLVEILTDTPRLWL